MAVPPPLQPKLRRLHYLLHPFAHFLRRDILDMRSNAPQMSERIANEAIAVSIELILHRLQDFRALIGGPLNYGVDVGKVYVQAYRAPAPGGRAGVPLPHAGIFVGQHDMRITDLQLGVTDLAVRAVHADGFGRANNFLVILDGLGSPL